MTHTQPDDEVAKPDRNDIRKAREIVYRARAISGPTDDAEMEVARALASERAAGARRERDRWRRGPNHKCSSWRHSGDGYNRTRVCSCGAEDHDPEPGVMGEVFGRRAQR